MADNISNKKGQTIHVQTEEGNLVVIDPNKTDSVDGVTSDRYVSQEDLIYFVNLEADVSPRSVLDLGATINPNRKTVASGTVNYLGPNNGKSMDTRWTEDFTQSTSNNNVDGPVNTKTVINESDTPNSVGYENYDYKLDNVYNTQLLGIKDVQIKTQPDNLKTSVITIRMVDIRGKALFEKGPASIYSTFFHLPYPIFTLTVKGFYGEAVTYSLILSNAVKVQFETDGDYYITATFMATNQKLLNDIRLSDAIVAPYLYEKKTIREGNDGALSVCKNTMGYDILQTIYSEYVSDGLVSPILAEKPMTIPHLMEYVNQLDIKLENNLFAEKDISFFSEITKYGHLLKTLSTAVTEWFRTYTNVGNPVPILGTNDSYVIFKKEYLDGIDRKDKVDVLTGDRNDTLKTIFDGFKKKLGEVKYFGKGPNTITLENGTKGKSKSGDEISFNPPNLSNLIFNDFYFGNEKKRQMQIYQFEGKVEKLLEEYNSEFSSIKDKVQSILEKTQEETLGFKPTLKNVMGIILANTECFLRVMDETHRLAYSQRTDKSRINTVKSIPENPDNVNDNVYPFPTVYGKNKKGVTEQVYPGDPKIKHLTKGADLTVWPEVKLVNEYLEVLLEINDNSAGELCTSAIEELVGTNLKEDKNINIFSSDVTLNDSIYSDAEFTKITYGIYNRIIYSVFGTGFSIDTIKSLAKEDAKNVTKIINRLNSGRKLFTNETTFFSQLFNENFLQKDTSLIEEAKENRLTKSSEKTLEDENSFRVISDGGSGKSIEDGDKVFKKEFKSYVTNGFEPYPFTDSDWVSNNLEYGNNVFNRSKSYEFNTDYNYPTSTGGEDEISLITYYDPLLTPGFVTTDNLIARAYWLLQTQKTKSLLDVYSDEGVKENYFARFLGGDIKEISKLQMLKWGSAWYRYTQNKIDGVDIMSEIWKDLDISQYNGLGLSISGDDNTFVFDKNANRFDVGFYPELNAKILSGLLGEEIEVSDLQGLIDSGSLIIKKGAPIKIIPDVIDDTTVFRYISPWKSYFTGRDDNGDFMYVNLPSFVEHLTDKIDTIKEDEVHLIINASINQSWDDSINVVRMSSLEWNNPSMIPSSDKFIFDKDGEFTGESIESLSSLFSYQSLEKFKDMFLDFSRSKDEIVVGEIVAEDLYGNLISVENVGYSSDNGESIKDIGLDVTEMVSFDKSINVEYSIISSLTNTNISSGIKTDPYVGIDYTLFDVINGPLSNGSVNIKRRFFFELMDIDASEDNMIKYKGIVSVFAQWVKDLDVSTIDGDTFKSYLTSTVMLGVVDKLDTYTETMFTYLKGSVVIDGETEEIAKTNKSLGDNYDVHNSIYRSLKNINDAWIGGRMSWKKTNLAKLFKYLNYHNEPIGDDFIMDVRIIKDHFESMKKGKSIGSFISMLLKGNSLSEPISMGASTNYFGNLVSSDDKIKDAGKVAESIFGVHTKVKSNSLPGFVVYFRSHSSEYLKIKKSNFGYRDDGVDLASGKKNALSSQVLTKKRITEGNRGISFNVDFGVQNQNMFTDFSIQSHDGAKSGEELIVVENLANQNNGASTTTIATNLMELMKTRVYSCTIKSMGNVMIQPFMYFNLRFIPIYSGSYIILSVEHSMSPDTGMVTTFTGVRISEVGLGSLNNAMVKANVSLLESLIKKLNNKVQTLKSAKDLPQYSGDTNEQGGVNEAITKQGNCKLSSRWKELELYQIKNTSTTKSNKEMVDYSILAVQGLDLTNEGKENLARYVFSVVKREQGRGNGARFYHDNPFGYHVDNGSTQAFKKNVKGYFCPMVSDGYKRATALFHNPNTESVDIGIPRALNSFAIDMKSRGENFFNDSSFWDTDNAGSETYLASLWAFRWNTSYKAIKSGGRKGVLITDFTNGEVKYKGGKTKKYQSSIKSFKSFMGIFNRLK